MLSIEEQTNIAVEYVRHIANGGIDEKYIADDMTAWSLSMGLVPRSRYWPRLKHVKAVFTTPLEMTIVSTMAEPGRIMVESSSCGRLYTGDEYRNDYVFLIEFNDQDQVQRVREYFNVEKLRATLLPALLRYEAEHGLSVPEL